MPRKTKEQKELENNEKTSLKSTAKKSTSKTNLKKEETKKTSSAKKTTAKKAVSEKKEASKKATTKKSVSGKKETSKKATTKKSVSGKKEASKKATAKKTSSAKKPASKKTTAKKVTTKKATAKKAMTEVVEYYDLPYRYNQTVVKVLAQTPTTLFIYWDIADSDRQRFEEQYGNNFFETTRPVLIVYNDSLGYAFEVEINDFANSWYLHVADSKCDYRIELGRRPIVKNENFENTDYVYVATSNEIESPNDRILLDKEQKMVYFKNVKTGEQIAKPITSMSFIRNMGKIYNIYDLYKAIYHEENIDEFYDLSNPSSGNPSSGTFSSKFRK